MQLKKRTPCVGICSTTYGDLVCRGCKRFAHEIVQWNGYDDVQQDAVRDRLQRVRDEVLTLLLVCCDEGLLQSALSDAGLQDLDLMEAQYPWRAPAWRLLRMRRSWPPRQTPSLITF
jgi:predicted Fe-S protein YdhL (DUF1289 family)